MAAITPNVAKGRVNELARRINANDPANSVFVLVALVSSTPLATFKDYDTLAQIIADGGTDEAAHTGYARIVLDNTDGITVTVDDSGDLQFVDFPDQAFEDVDGDDDDITHLVVGYDPDSTGGDDTSIVPVNVSDFAISPNGGDINVVVDSDGAFVAGE